MALFRGALFDEELVWGRALRSDDRFCFQRLRVPGEQNDKFLRWGVANTCWPIDGTSRGCQFGTKIEAWMWYRDRPSLADLPFQEGDAAVHLVLSAQAASIRREVTPSGADAQYVALPELCALSLAYSFWAADRAQKVLRASIRIQGNILAQCVVLACVCCRGLPAVRKGFSSSCNHAVHSWIVPAVVLFNCVCCIFGGMIVDATSYAIQV
eukprot:9615286-Alexandrium_andersonii.AAC.1